MQVRVDIRGLTFVDDGQVFAVLSPAHLRLALALERLGKPLPAREATRIIWPERTGPLTGSQRSSASTSIGRLLAGGLIDRRVSGGAVYLTTEGSALLSQQRPRIAEALKIGS
jgi:hypothetical protein